MIRKILVFIILLYAACMYGQIAKSDSLRVAKASEHCLDILDQGLVDSAKKETFKFIILIRSLELKYPGNKFLSSQRLDAMDYVSYLSLQQGRVQDALTYADSVLQIYKARRDSFNIALSLNNIGYMFQTQEMLKKAMDNYQQALTILRKDSSDDARMYTATLENNIGLLFENRRMGDSALTHYFKALNLRKALNDRRGISESMNNIGMVLHKRGESEKALPYVEEAYKIKKEIGDNDGIVYTAINLSLIYNRLGNPEKALPFAEEGFRLGEKGGRIDVLANSSRALATIYYKTRDFKNAYDYLDLYLGYHDSLVTTSNKKALYKHEVRNEYEKKETLLKAEQEKKDLIAAEEIRRQRIIIYSATGGAIMLLLVIIFVYRSYLLKKRSNDALTQKNSEILYQKHLIEEKNTEILDSINYAKRIQTAILPPARLVNKCLPQSFILYKPKDIVAGDFYWIEEKQNKILFAAADCTGHGVPGAMVSVICNNGLNRSVREYGLTDPGKILDKAREIIIQEFEKSDEEVKDGMDISLCSVEYKDKEVSLEWAGANNSLWIIRKGSGSLEEIKADKQPIGKYAEAKNFTTHRFSLSNGDTVYIFTDGYQDQFGGEKGKKFKAAKLKELLLSIQSEQPEDQKVILNTAFEDWKKDLEQVDDVCIIGVKL